MSDEDRKTFQRLGAISLVLGFLAATDSAYELHETDKARPGAVFEFVLAQAAIVTGLGLLQRRGWALQAAVVTAVAGFIHSLLGLIFFGAALLQLLTILGDIYDHSPAIEYGTRLFLILAQVLFWPIVLGHLYIDLQCRAADDPAAAREGKRTFWTYAVVAAPLTVLVEMVLVRLPQPA